MKKFSLFLSIFGFIIVGSFLLSTSKIQAADVAINGATKTNVIPGTQFSLFKGVPVFRLLVNNTGTAPDAITSLSPTPSGTVNDTLITLHFYNDLNNNGYVDQGDTNLGASAAFAVDDTIQTFDITDVAVAAGGSASIIVTADGTGALLNAENFTLSFAAGTSILMTVEPLGTFPLTNANALTISTSVPSLTIADGANDPASPHTAAASDTNVSVKQLAISAAAGTSDSIVSLAPTPTGTENDNLNISSVGFYIDSGSVLGQFDVTDIPLVTTPATYTANNVRTVFTFSSPVQVAAGSTVNILMVYNLGAGVTPNRTLYAQIAAVGDVIAGSGTALNGDTSTISDLITISGGVANIAVASAKVNSSNTVLVTMVDPGNNLASIDYTKWHIDVGDGGDGPGGPLTPTSATITSAGTPWTITLTFSGPPFSINTAFSAAQGLYVDASGVTDTNGDTNIVVGHAASTIITDGQAPTITSVTSNAIDAGVLGIGQTIIFTATPAVTETGLTISPTTYNGGTLSWNTANSGVTYTAVYTVIEGQSNQGTALQLTGVTATDTAGNTSSPVSGSDVVKTIDANSPTTPVINAVAADNIINAAERTATVTVTGTNEAGSTVTLNGNATNPLTGTTWNYVLDAAAINTFGQGAETLTAIATDAAGNVNVANGTRAVTVDTVAPTISSVLALKQDGGATTIATNIWYYYSGKSLRFTVTANESLSAVKACVRSITGNNSALTCGPSEFSGSVNTDYINFATDLGSNVYEFNTALSSLTPISLPTTAGGYPLNIQLTDTAGNITYGTLPSESFTGVFGIDPKTLISELNNATTTAWSSILDFTSVTDLTFNANDGINDVGTLVLTGPINLTATATITGLQSLGTNMTVSGSVMRIDSSALAAFNGGATLTMKMSSAVRPGLIVKDNTGTIDGYVSNSNSSDVIVGGKTLGSFTWDGTAQTLTFTTTGFSEFDSDNTAPTNQDTVFASSVSKISGATVTVVSAGETGGAIWFAPSGTTTFTSGTTMTTAGGTATSILVPSTVGSYKLYVIDATGNKSSASTATLTVSSSSSSGTTSGGGYRPYNETPAPALGGCSGGNLYNTSTGQLCINNNKSQISGCGNRNIGFSTATGQSCIGNFVPAQTKYNFGTSILKNGSKGESVMELQRFLNKVLNLGLVVDGKLGPKTIAVIKKWQTNNGLVSDGIVGDKTKTRMNSVQ